jgi:putative nucleotidyltransferase with HDIG domain
MEKKKKNLSSFMQPGNSVPWVLLFAVLLLFIITLYPNLVITQPKYEVGDVAKHDIKAAKDFFIEDQAATLARRKQAVDAVLTVYDHDSETMPDTTGRVKKAFALLRDIHRTYRDAPVPEPVPDQAVPAEPAAAILSLPDLVNQKKDEFQKVMGITVSKGAYKILAKDEFSIEIENLIVEIITQVLDNGVVGNKELLLRESEKGVTLRNIKTKSERPVTKLKRFYGLDQAKTMVRIIGQPLLKGQNYSLRNLTVDFAQELIRPNITLNRSETEERKKGAAAGIKPILYQIKADEMLLREGDRVSAMHLLKLKKSRLPAKTERPLLSSMGAGLIMLCLIMAMFIPQFKSMAAGSKDLNKNLLFISIALVSAFFFVRLNIFLISALAQNPPFQLSTSSIIYGLPMAAGSMTVCLFMGLQVAIPFAVVLATGTAAILHNDFGTLIYFLISCTMGGYWLQNCRERKVFIKAGLKLGLLNVLLVIGLDAYRADMADLHLMWDCIFAFTGGIGAGIVTAGLAPLIEIAFDYTTDIKLLELANLDRPILRQLMMKAPGTYHHSIVVGSLVEAAADEIDANPLLAKVCGYYHDIGKINKPLYFIENQRNGKNRHDKLAPSMSKTILLAHVKNGVAIARENKLGPVIIDTIRQSHGTSLIKFFYSKACRQNPEDSISMDDYRYPGPRPQTREAGLVMLADVVEAASRTLENPTPARVQGLVQTLINDIFSDGQLDHCELTLKDLHAIAKNFISILTGIHHHRIEYPEKSGRANGNTKNGNTDRQSANQTADKPGKDTKNGPGHLKRLGLP